MKKNATDLRVVVGLGATGFSCAQYLHQCGFSVAVTDTREQPPFLEALKNTYPDITVSLGKLDEHLLDQAAEIIVSPGLALQEPAIARQIQKGTPIIGDIELFARATTIPVIAITGTNAKSTVTTLVGEMAKAAGIRTEVGGNLGIPALDLIEHHSNPELFVLELSSFQLETTFSLNPIVATILNVTPDHMDRYAHLDNYIAAKQRVYQGCQVAVCNRDDPQTECGDHYSREKLYFSLQKPGKNEFGLLTQHNETFLAFEDNCLLPVSALPIHGRHYQANALAALAIGHGAGFALDPMLKVLKEFKGLPHRCQLVRKYNQVDWYNDSKGTNVGATLAAIEGLGSEMKGKLVLIAGGVGKNADFSPLLPAIEKYVRSLILIGEAAPQLAQVVGDKVDVRLAASMEDAIAKASKAAVAGDLVLLSPACASFDMFKNYAHRGEVFTQLVQEMKIC